MSPTSKKCPVRLFIVKVRQLFNKIVSLIEWRVVHTQI